MPNYVALHVKLQTCGVKNPLILIHFREAAAIERGQDSISDKVFDINRSGIVNRRGATCGAYISFDVSFSRYDSKCFLSICATIRIC
jgi:hypothetical protein